MKKGDFIKIKYAGRIKGSNKIFDTNIEEVARKEGVYSEKGKFTPITAIVGEKYVVEGLDDSFLEHNVGEKYTAEIPKEKGFGLRDPELIKLVPMRKFKEQKINPFPGLPVSVDGKIGAIRSISGGRVTVDFNHPLSGRDLVYDVEIIEELKDKKEKIKGLFEFHAGVKPDGFDIELKEKILMIRLRTEIPKFLKTKAAKEITEKIPNIEKIEFVETYEKA